MALVRCPECGESISSTAKKCIHCGANFHGTCFECGGLIVEGESVCRQCGANQNATAEERVAAAAIAAPSTQEANKKVEADDIAEGAKIEAEMTSIMQKRKERDKKFYMWRSILDVPMILFWVIPLFIILKKIDDMAQVPLYMRSVIWMENSSVLLFMLIISTMCMIADVCLNTYISFNGGKEQTQEMEALGKEKWRYYIKQNASKSRDKKEQAAFNNVLRIGYFLENPEKKENPVFSKIKAIIGVCSNIGWCILIIVLIYGMGKLGMETGIGSKGKLFAAKLKDLLVPILMLLIINLPFGIRGLICESKTKKEIKLYQESILAEDNK
ncbi:MAG: zinc ribbon domain-containing protein [Clostridiales bacterium]|nr:zinc ribbon domain-containing protein [Clostridiales bacterium]